MKDQQIPRKHRETTEQIKEINTGSGYEIHFKKLFWKHNKNLGDKKIMNSEWMISDMIKRPKVYLLVYKVLT